MASTSAKLGLMLSNRDPVIGQTNAEELISLCVSAEQSSVIDHVWVGDSLLAKPRLEALCLLAALAANTSQIRLGTAALASLPLRNPILLAIQWATIDQLSNGRMIMGVSIGGAQRTGGAFLNEYEAFGIDPHDRVKRLEEAIGLLRSFWSGKEVTFQGEYWNYEALKIGVVPNQKEPPIWLVSSPFETGKEHLVNRGLRRVAKYADGWMASRLTTDQYRIGKEMINAYATDFNRDGSQIDKAFCGHIFISESKKKAYANAANWINNYYMTQLPEKTIRLWTGLGAPEDCARWIQAYINAGANHILIRFASFDWSEQLTLFLDEVVPRLDLRSHS